jgi:adenine-specific DNA-methyltransferase
VAAKRVEPYEHTGATRPNNLNPPVGLVTSGTDPLLHERKTYAHDPHLDPRLVWAGKAERTSFEGPTVALHVHERIDPRTILEGVRRQKAHGGFGVWDSAVLLDPNNLLPILEKAAQEEAPSSPAVAVLM